MGHYPNDLRYTITHEWVKIENNIATIGITDFAQKQLGDLVFVELPKLNRTVKGGDEVVVVESVKTAADVYSPVSGTIVEINNELSATPENINQDPYGKGWLFRLKLEDPQQGEKLLSAKDYQSQIETK